MEKPKYLLTFVQESTKFALVASAKRNRRSLNMEINVRLEASLKSEMPERATNTSGVDQSLNTGDDQNEFNTNT